MSQPTITAPPTESRMLSADVLRINLPFFHKKSS